MAYKDVTCTPLEMKALWLVAEHGSKRPPAEVANDPDLSAAAERALHKVWCSHTGQRIRMKPQTHQKRGAELDCRRKTA